MSLAHFLYKIKKHSGVSFGECLAQSWEEAKEAIQIRERQAKREAEIQAEAEAREAQMRAIIAEKNAALEANLKATGMSLETWTMTTQYYGTGAYCGD